MPTLRKASRACCQQPSCTAASLHFPQFPRLVQLTLYLGNIAVHQVGKSSFGVRPVPFAIQMKKGSPAGLTCVAIALPSPVVVPSPTSPDAVPMGFDFMIFEMKEQHKCCKTILP